MSEAKPIAVIGLMGAGKTAVARALGARLGRQVAALDADVERETGLSVAALFARDGEAAFRVREAAALRHALERGAGVIDGGGGLVLDPANRALLRARCRVVWLEVEPAEAARRVTDGGAERPLLAGGTATDRLDEILASRAAHYAETAHVRVATGGRDVEAVVTEVLRVLEAVA